MITKIDANGRIQLPPTIRYCLDLNAGDQLAVDHLGDGTIIIKKIEAEMHLADAELAEANCVGLADTERKSCPAEIEGMAHVIGHETPGRA